VTLGGRRVGTDLGLFPHRQLVNLVLSRQLGSHINVDNVRPRNVATGKLRAIAEENSVLAGDLRRLPSVTEQMNQRPLNTETHRLQCFDAVKPKKKLKVGNLVT